MLSDDELEEIRKRKMELLIERAKKPKVQEPLANGFVNLLYDGNFWQTIQQTKLAVVDFFGEWCMPCKTLSPILAELASEYAGKVYFAKVDIDRNRRTTAQFGVQSVPNVFIFRNAKPIGNIPGLRTFAEYDSVLEQLSNPDESDYA
jgi:thioredoxin 1